MEGPHAARFVRHRLALPRHGGRARRSRDDRERNAGTARAHLVAERPRHVPHRLQPHHGAGAEVLVVLTATSTSLRSREAVVPAAIRYELSYSRRETFCMSTMKYQRTRRSSSSSRDSSTATR